MKKKNKIVILLILLIVVVASVVAFTMLKKSKVDNTEVTVVVMDKGRCPASEGTMENNRWTEYIKEESEVKIRYIAVARDNFEENLNLLIGSGTVPDIMLTYEDTYVAQLANQGVIQPVDKFVEKYSTTYKQYLKEHPELEKYVMFDGKMYALTNERADILDQGMWIRQDWLDKLNLKMPTTEQELLEVCKAFKEAKLGGEKTVPIALMRYCWDYFASLYNAKDIWYVNENGKVEYGTLTNRFKSATQLMKTMYDNGYISKEYAVDTDSSMATQQWVNGNAGMILFKADASLMQTLLENDPTANPVPVPAFKTEYGINSFYQSSMANSYIMISSEIKNPEGAMKFLDWLLDEGWYTLKNGFQGTHYELNEDNYPVSIAEGDVKSQISYTSLYMLLADEKITEASILAKAGEDEMAQKIAKLQIKSREVNSKNTFRRDFPRNPDVEEFAILHADWQNIALQLFTKAITGGENYSVDNMMQDMQKEWKSLGGEKVTRLVQQWYETNFK